MAGQLNAYDLQTGNLEWSYESGDPTNEVLWGNNWPVYPMFITDGKIYLGHSEHSPVDPKSRGAPFHLSKCNNWRRNLERRWIYSA